MTDKRFSTYSEILKVDDSLGMVFGFAIVSTEEGEPYFDLQGEHIPDETMLKAASDFMTTARSSKEMHEGESTGQVVFAFPLTAEIAKALGIDTPRTGLLIGLRPSTEALAKFKDGTYTGFSIGGRYVETEEVE